MKEEPYPLATPLICPFCGYEGVSNTHTGMQFGKLPGDAELKDFTAVEWECPSCRMWITEEDEETI